MKNHLRRTVQKAFLLLVVLLLTGCQTPVQPSPTPTSAYRTPTPIPTSPPEQNPILQAFRRLEELDSYRMSVTMMNGGEIRSRYTIEKQGQGHLRIDSMFFDSLILIVDGKQYRQDSSGTWVVGNDTTNEDYWLMFPFTTGDNGCTFGFDGQPTVEGASDEGIFHDTVIWFTHQNYVESNPGYECKLTLRKGIPFLMTAEALGVDRLFLVRFTNLNGEDIAPIAAPMIP